MKTIKTKTVHIFTINGEPRSPSLFNIPENKSVFKTTNIVSIIITNGTK